MCIIKCTLFPRINFMYRDNVINGFIDLFAYYYKLLISKLDLFSKKYTYQDC